MIVLLYNELFCCIMLLIELYNCYKYELLYHCVNTTIEVSDSKSPAVYLILKKFSRVLIFVILAISKKPRNLMLAKIRIRKN